MTTLGAVSLIAISMLAGGWILDLVRRGRLYVGYGIVVLALVGIVVGIASWPWFRALLAPVLYGLFPREPVAVIGLGALLLLLIYVLHQLSVLSDRVAALTQEIALRVADKEHSEGSR